MELTWIIFTALIEELGKSVKHLKRLICHFNLPFEVCNLAILMLSGVL